MKMAYNMRSWAYARGESDMKIKTQDLNGVQLDYAVDLVEGGYANYLKRFEYAEAKRIEAELPATCGPLTYRNLYATPTCPRYSVDWANTGPIIDREQINLSWSIGYPAKATIYNGGHIWFDADGPTPLIAAMRCYVTSKLGNEVEIPEELI